MTQSASCSTGVHTEHHRPSGSTQTPSKLLAVRMIPTPAKPKGLSCKKLQAVAVLAATPCSSRCPCSLPRSCWGSGCLLLGGATRAQAGTWVLQAAGTSPYLWACKRVILYLKVLIVTAVVMCRHVEGWFLQLQFVAHVFHALRPSCSLCSIALIADPALSIRPSISCNAK